MTKGRRRGQGRRRPEAAHRRSRRQAAAGCQHPADLRAHAADPPHGGHRDREPRHRRAAGDRDPDRVPAQLAGGADRRQRDPARAAGRVHPDGCTRRFRQPSSRWARWDFGIIIDSAVVLVEALMVKLAVEAANRDYAPPHGGAAAHGGRAGAPDPVLKGDHHYRLPADLHLPARRGKDLRAGRADAVFRTRRGAAAHADPGARAAVLCHPARQHGRDPRRLAGPTAGALPAPAGVGPGALAPRVSRLARGTRVRGLPARRCSARNSCPSWTRATSGSPSRCPRPTALERTKEVEREVRAILRSYPEVEAVISQVGRPDDGNRPEGAEQPRSAGRPEAARAMALRFEGRAGRRHVGAHPRHPGPADQFLAGDPGQRRGSALPAPRERSWSRCYGAGAGDPGGSGGPRGRYRWKTYGAPPTWAR